MLHIGLMVHSRRTDALQLADRVSACLKQHQAVVYAEDEIARTIHASPISEARVVDVMISLGGDGTLLRAAQLALKWDASLLGINLGRVGFLTEAEPDRIEEVLEALVQGRYTTETRPVLQVCTADQKWNALNDAVLSRGSSARLTTINAWVDGELAGRFVADGVVVATPTGSTGYSLSAGGPIVSPHVDCMVITPICAHTLQHRPTVVPGCAHITLEMIPEDEQRASLQVDGQSCAELAGGMRAEISMDSRRIRLIRIHEQHFFQLVRDKLTEWTR